MVEKTVVQPQSQLAVQQAAGSESSSFAACAKPPDIEIADLLEVRFNFIWQNLATFLQRNSNIGAIHSGFLFISFNSFSFLVSFHFRSALSNPCHIILPSEERRNSDMNIRMGSLPSRGYVAFSRDFNQNVLSIFMPTVLQVSSCNFEVVLNTFSG